jgi:hypothetical protein
MCTTAEALVKTEATSFVCASGSLTENRPATAIARPTLPRPPHPVPTFVTMANAPRERRDGGNKPVICLRSEAEYFCDEDWTGGIRLIRFRKSMFRRIAPWEATEAYFQGYVRSQSPTQIPRED